MENYSHFFAKRSELHNFMRRKAAVSVSQQRLSWVLWLLCHLEI